MKAVDDLLVIIVKFQEHMYIFERMICYCYCYYCYYYCFFFIVIVINILLLVVVSFFDEHTMLSVVIWNHHHHHHQIFARYIVPSSMHICIYWDLLVWIGLVWFGLVIFFCLFSPSTRCYRKQCYAV